MPRFQSPPRRTQWADFPLYAHLFASHQGLCDLSCWCDFQLRAYACIPPLPTPPPPAEALSILKPRNARTFQPSPLTYSPPRVLHIDGRLYHLVRAFPIEGDLTNSRAPSLHGRYPASIYE